MERTATHGAILALHLLFQLDAASVRYMKANIGTPNTAQNKPSLRRTLQSMNWLCGRRGKYSRTCLIRYFFVGPGRIPIFCVEFCSPNSLSSNSSPLSIPEKRFVRLIRHLQFRFWCLASQYVWHSNKLRIFIWELLHLAICLSNLYTRCEVQPHTPLRESIKSLKFIKDLKGVRLNGGVEIE